MSILSEDQLTEEQLAEQSTLHLLHRAGQCADELFALNASDVDLTPRQFEVLRSVSLLQEPSQTALVERTGIDRSTLADIVRRLVERGLLQRRRTRKDARMYAVRLTDAGAKALEKIIPAVDTTNKRLLSALPSEDRQAFVSALATIVSTIGPISSARTSNTR
jgi:DNA-binding MarR family transcriptional regulator